MSDRKRQFLSDSISNPKSYYKTIADKPHVLVFEIKSDKAVGPIRQLSDVLKYLGVCMSGYPLNTIKPELKDETLYPNGTIVGKYNYLDNKGNPIHVKYYADDFSYGVELKSVKVSNNSEDPDWLPSNNFDIMKPIVPPLSMRTEILTPLNPTVNKLKYNNKNKDTKKQISAVPDYETFYQNDIKTPRQCEQNKVRVYLDKEKKLIKRALDKVAKYCDQF